MTPYRSTSNLDIDQRQVGFTLLEILVAMTILTLIVTAAFGAIRLGERSWEAGLRHTTESENMRTVSSALQRLFRQSLQLKWKQNTKTAIAFSGDAQKLSFIAPAPQHHGATGLFEYTLALEAENDNNKLMLYYRLHDPDRKGFAEEGEDRQQVILVKDLANANFSFYGSPGARESSQWHSNWDSDADNFPAMVHVQLDPQVEQNRWPDMFLALHTVVKK